MAGRRSTGLIALDPDHASLYLLELYPNAPLREAMARASWSLAPDDDAAEMYLWAMARLEAAGYAQYEISNVARPGRESRHNLKYWRDGAWLGFGCGAHSTRGAAALEECRRRPPSTWPAWRQAGTSRSSGRPAPRRSSSKTRCSRDCASRRASTAGASGRATVWTSGSGMEHALRPHIDAGRLVFSDDRLRLTREGMLVANDVMTVFV